jgi:hypothetical protein
VLHVYLRVDLPAGRRFRPGREKLSARWGPGAICTAGRWSIR